MATLLIDGVNESIAATYDTASEEEKQQVKHVIEDILRLWTQWRTGTSTNDQLRQKAIEFALNHKTFPLDWSHNKLTREELNER
jgi:hypothetical protein